ncbi:hypothetical protein LQ327_01240 [Actinomycetospora endophytica]|uniref:Uncharacterized protein n=1 Tax=Actinomycetospora endophytica TaxID=2291215 RepID=A0ABS8P199_9PSEU|nr:hypothetical protein [Actinomycetospora endophytica]MCD2192015.1 hypothetical protein [Actinomycetospora endophytica]
MTDISAGQEPVEQPRRVAKNRLTPQHSGTSWRWQWFTSLGQHEVAYLPVREAWFTRYRSGHPEGDLGLWNEPQAASLPRPTNCRHAARIAQRYADTRRTSSSAAPTTRRRARRHRPVDPADLSYRRTFERIVGRLRH